MESEIEKKLIADLERYKEKENEVCEWTPSKDFVPNTVYDTECDARFIINPDTHYCPCCGKKIKILPYH